MSNPDYPREKRPPCDRAGNHFAKDSAYVDPQSDQSRTNQPSTPPMEAFACLLIVNDVMTRLRPCQCSDALSCGFQGLCCFYEPQFSVVEQVAEYSKDAKRESHRPARRDLKGLQMSLKLKWPICCPIETCFPVFLLLLWDDLNDGTRGISLFHFGERFANVLQTLFGQNAGQVSDRNDGPQHAERPRGPAAVENLGHEKGIRALGDETSQ